MKKALALLVLLTLTALVALTGCQIPGDFTNPGNETSAYDEAASVFTIDINPGVRFYLTANETVIAVEASNEDGEKLVAELNVEGADYEAALEAVVDEAIEQGFIDEEEPSVLITIEKDTTDGEAATEGEGATEGDTSAEGTETEDTAEGDLSDKVAGKLDRVLGKHGKRARVIAQKLEKLEKDVRENVKEIAKKHGISEGKANVIDKIIGEFPELDEGELADLDMGKLGLLLGETGESVQKHFDKFEKALDEVFIGKEAALEKALLSISTDELTVTKEDVLDSEVRISREDGKMIYEVRFVYGENVYEIELDAELGEVIETEIEKLVEFDVDKEIDKFFDERGDFFENMLDKLEEESKESLDHWRDKHHEYVDEMKDAFFGKGDKDHHDRPEGDKPEDGKNDGGEENKIIGRTEAIKVALELFDISRDDVIESRVKVHSGKNGTLVSIKLVLEGDVKYDIVLEAYTASVIRASKNGEPIDLSVGENGADNTEEDVTSDNASNSTDGGEASDDVGATTDSAAMDSAL